MVTLNNSMKKAKQILFTRTQSSLQQQSSNNNHAPEMKVISLKIEINMKN